MYTKLNTNQNNKKPRTMKATTTNRQKKFIHTSAKYLFVFIKYCLESGVGSQFIAPLNRGK